MSNTFEASVTFIVPDSAASIIAFTISCGSYFMRVAVFCLHVFDSFEGILILLLALPL